MLLQLFISSVILCSIHSGQAQRCVYCNRTPQTLQIDFQDSCKDVLGASQTTLCGSAYNAFISAFAGKHPDAVKDSDYLPYFQTLPIIAGADQNLFWSGTFPIVQRVSENNLGAVVVSSTNANSSEIINHMRVPEDGLAWCGNSSGIDYFTPCKCRVTDLFWSEFSGLFAIAASGKALFLADGERCGGAFSLESFFATVELPNMTASVSTVVAIVVHESGKGESCVTGSLVTLQNLVVNTYKKKFECYEVIGSATDPAQKEAVSKCVGSVIGTIQNGGTPPTVNPCAKMLADSRRRRRMRFYYGLQY